MVDAMNTQDEQVGANGEEVIADQLTALLETTPLYSGRIAGESTLNRMSAIAKEGSRSGKISSQNLKAMVEEKRLEKVFNKELERRETKHESFKKELQKGKAHKKSDAAVKRAKKASFAAAVPALFGMAAVTLIVGFMGQIQSQILSSKAKHLIASGENDKAYKFLHKSLIWNPYNANASYEAGRIDEHRKERQVAYTHFSRALKVNPNNVELLDHKGALALKLKQFDVAAETYSHLLQVSKASRKQLHHYGNRAVAYSQLAQYDKAIEDYTSVLKMKRNDQDSLVGRAFCHIALNEFSVAINDLDRLLVINPKHYEGLLLKGWAHQSLTLNSEAQSDYEAATALQPKNEKAYMYLANSYRATGNMQEALKQLDKVIAINPASRQAHADKGQILLAVGQHKEALQHFKTVDNVKVEENYYSLVDRAKASLGAGENKVAINCYSKLIALKPELSELYFDRARAEASIGEYQPAIKDLDVAIKLYPHYTQAMLNRANCNIKLGNEVSAITDFNNAIASAPNSAKPYVEFGKFNLAKKQFVTARECFEKAVKFDGKDKTARELSLVANQNLKKLVGNKMLNEDVNALSRNEVAEINSADFNTLLENGYQSLKSGKLNYAETALDKAVRLDPNSKIARRYYATTLMLAGQANRAESQVSILSQMGAGDDNDNRKLAASHRKAGNCQRAIELLDLHIATHPTDINSMLELSESYAALGNIEKATDVCFAAMNKSSNSPNYARLKERYLSLKHSQTRMLDQKAENAPGGPVDTQG